MEIPGPGPAVRSPSTGSGRTDTILRAPEHLPSHRFSHAVRSPHCRGPTGLSVPRIAGGLRACPFPILPGAYGPVRSPYCRGPTGLSVPCIAWGLRACPFPALPGAYGPVRSPYCRGPTGLSVPHIAGGLRACPFPFDRLRTGPGGESDVLRRGPFSRSP